MKPVTIAVPDLVSPSYFPAEAAVVLGCFEREGLAAELSLVCPVERAYAEMRDGSVDIVAGSAHSIFSAFPRAEGAKLICAQSQGMYWFLVMHARFGARRGELDVVKGRRIGAAPWVGLGLKGLLEEAGHDLERDGITIAPTSGSLARDVNFGLAAARALESGEIDGFWANGMGAEIALRMGIGTVVLDVRRGDGPSAAFDFTAPTLAVTDRLLAERPEVAAGAVRAIAAAQRLLGEDPTRARIVADRLFPDQADLIVDLVRRDLPFYGTQLSPGFVAGMVGFSQRVGILDRPLGYADVVAAGYGG